MGSADLFHIGRCWKCNRQLMYRICLETIELDPYLCDMCFTLATRDKLRVFLQRLPNNIVKGSALITTTILNVMCRTKGQATGRIKRKAMTSSPGTCL